MKKFFLGVFCFFVGLFCYSNNYQITKIDYSITPSAFKFLGITNKYCLEQKVPVDCNKIFESEEELNFYLQDYEQRLNNTRVFEDLSVDFEIINIQASENEIYNVFLKVNLVDSIHIFILPGPKYDSNNGLTLKLKIKDFNFLGTLNTMNSDLYFLIPTADSDNTSTELGINFSFDYPFKAGIFDSVWVNDVGISYTFGDSLPEWDYTTGIQFTLPLNNNKSFIWEVYQKSYNNFDYLDFGDSLYFSEEIKLSLPINIHDSVKLGSFYYTPYIDSFFNWDFDSISPNNSSLSSPVIEIGHSFTFGRVDWNNNLRDGIDFSISNYFSYNFQRNILYPLIKLNTEYFKSIDLLDGPFLHNLGFNTQIEVFTYLNNPSKNEFINYDGISIGSSLRGIRDDQNFYNTSISALTETAAIVVNLDMPIQILKTNFTSKFLSYFNFNLQISPFIDFALVYNKINKSWFNPKDGFYSAGLEFIVFPSKWSGITVRANFGYDIGRKFLKNFINTDWRSDSSMYELYFGLGLHY